MKSLKLPLISASVALALASCAGSGAKDASAVDTVPTASGIVPANFVDTIDGKTTGLYTMRNANGMEVCVTNYGGRIVSIMVPDKEGKLKDVVLGFDNVNDYKRDVHQTDFGASIGRYANRIDHGMLPMEGDTVIQLVQNNVIDPATGKFMHSLHGGLTGWQYQVYDVVEANDSVVKLQIVSPDGDNGFPGTVTANVTYTLTPDNSIDIAYEATTDKPTVINMTNHSYFNLNGDADQDILNNELQVNASTYTPVSEFLIPTGEFAPVAGTPFDFTTAKVIGADINADDQQIANGNGFDHNWVLDTKGDINAPAAILRSPVTGITLTVFTDEPGIQVYTGNFLDGTLTGKNGKVYNQRSAICLETQHYPDSPNHEGEEGWPTVRLLPGQTYTSHCIYSFGVEE